MGCVVKLLSKISKVPIDGDGHRPPHLPSPSLSVSLEPSFSLSLYLSPADSENIHFIRGNSCIGAVSERQQIQEADRPRGRGLILGSGLRASRGMVAPGFVRPTIQADPNFRTRRQR